MSTARKLGEKMKKKFIIILRRQRYAVSLAYMVFAYIYLACLRFLINEDRVIHFFEKLVWALFCKVQSYYYS